MHYVSYQQAGMSGHSRVATLKQPFRKRKPEFEPGKAKGEKEEGQEKPAGEMAQQGHGTLDTHTGVSYVTEREELTPPGGPLAPALPCTVNKQTNKSHKNFKLKCKSWNTTHWDKA